MYDYQTVATISEFRKAMRQPYAWPGGYPRFFMTHNETISYDGAKQIRRDILESLASGKCLYVGINFEDDSLICDITGKRIESAYGESEE